MDIEISNGELLDKITILKIKLIKIKDVDKQKHLMKEHDLLVAKMMVLTDSFDNKDDEGEYLKLFDQLFSVNEKLWRIEDQIREKESKNIFDKDFIELARSIYFVNDVRSKIKKSINELTKSNIVEVKQYSRY
jgi:triacylglycerol esterase/lipase EstA (alpha/beta hydrolase family)